jgi:hypothetical protein
MWQDVSRNFLPIFETFRGIHREPNFWHEACKAKCDRACHWSDLMGIFSRTRDIFAANFTELLDRAEDPARMIRMIILEMEETLVEVRASAARSIADSKEMRRALVRLNELQSSWTEKAELALSKDREDLAKQALIERQKAADMAESLQLELDSINETLKGYEADIAKLQGKLARGPCPPECHCDADRERRNPGPGPRSAARQPHRGRFLTLRSAGAARRFRRRPSRRDGNDRTEKFGRGNCRSSRYR